MVSAANQSYVLGLFSATNSASNGIISLDLSSLITAQSNTSALAAQAQAAKPVAPTAPWASGSETAAQASTNVQHALAGQPIVNESAAQLDLPGASEDYRKLFALYQGLTTLSDLANQAAAGNQDAESQSQLSKAFDSGLAQVQDFVNSSNFSKLRLAEGSSTPSASSTLPISKPPTTYVTAPLTNSMTNDVPAFDGDAQFNISVALNTQITVNGTTTTHSKTTNVPIDLSGMGTQTRSLANVVNYINGQLKTAGVQTRVAIDRIPGQPQTITAAGQTVTLPASADQFALQVNIGTSETVSFSAPQTANAVYVGETVGDPDPDKDPTTTTDADTNAQLLKFQTDTNNVDAPPQVAGQGNYVAGRVFSDSLGNNVGTIHAMQTGPDGSVYMIADVTGTVNGQAISGTQDTALLKYDAAGNLVYTRTLGAADTATGYNLAVSAQGQVAVVGSVTGAMNGTTDGALNSGGTGSFADQSDSFVSLYNSTGDEMWTERRGSRLQDQANAVTFSADGSTVYVAGQAQGTMPGGSQPIGGYDGYVEGFTTNAKTGAPQATFTQSFGTTGTDTTKGMVVDGNTMITASVENGHAVLRNFDLSSGKPVQVSQRDLGDLQGGTISGLALNGNGQVVIAGSTTNGALSAGTVTAAANGGTDAFVAQVGEDLSNDPNDAIAYYGGTGNDRATGLSVSSDGQVWITGTAGATATADGQTPVGKQDGFIANIDIASGAVNYSSRFTGKDGMASPTAIAVDSTGASILDRLGLPKGSVNGDTSTQLASESSLRPGEQFTISTGTGGLAKTITIDQGETLQTLATKIQRAAGFSATATVTTGLNGAQTLTIKPANAESTVTIGAGPDGKNALDTLGIPEGVLSQTVVNSQGQTSPADGGPKIYGLGLSSTLNLDSAAQITHAQAVLAAAQGVIRSAYQALVAAATPKSAQSAAATNPTANGTVPTYLTNQIANLQAGLARLTGGSSSGSSVSALI